MDLQYIIAQILAVVGSAFLAITFFNKSKKLILIFGCLCTVVYALVYFLLGAYTGMILNIVAIFRIVWFYINDKFGKKREYVSLIVCCLIVIVCGVATYTSWVDIIVILAIILYTYSIWQDNIAFYRWAGVVSSCGWITYNFACGAIFANITEIILMIIKIVGVAKLYINKTSNEEKQIWQDN